MDVALPSRSLCCRRGLALSFVSKMCFENHRCFSHKIRKQRRRLEQWPVVFYSAWYYSAGLSFLYFNHTTSQIDLYYTQYLRKKEKRRTQEKGGLVSLNMFNYGSRWPSSCPGNPFSPRNFPALNEQWADEPRRSARVGRVSHSCAPALAMNSAQLVSVRMRVGTNIPLTCAVNTVTCLITGRLTRGDRNPNYCELLLLSVLCT